MTKRLMPVIALIGVILLGLTGQQPAQWTALQTSDQSAVSKRNVIDPNDGLQAIYEDRPSYIPFEGVADAQPLATISVNYNGFTPAAQAAFQRAVDIWSTILTSPVPIRVNATFSALGTGVLGLAGGNFVFRNFAGAPVQNTWFVDVLADRNAGFDLNPGDFDIVAQFSSTANWYFGLDGRPAAGQFDFVSVVLHELCHGLGFTGTGRLDGSGAGIWGQGSPIAPYIFDRYVKNGSGQPYIGFPSPSPAAAGQLTSDNLFFVSPAALTAISAPAKLYAPATFRAGSTYSHLDEATYPQGNPNTLMTPQLAQMEAIHDPGTVTREILTDTGWGPLQTPPPGGVPPAPTNLVASVTGNTVTVSWTASPGATSYRLVAVGPGVAFDQNIGNLTAVSASGLPVGTYTVQVFAVNAAGQSALPAITSFTIGGGVPPPPPTSVTAVVSAGRTVTVTWPAVIGATSYIVTATFNGFPVFNQNVGNMNAVGASGIPAGNYTVTVFSVGPGGTSTTGTSASFVIP